MEASNTPTLQYSNTPDKYSLRLCVFAVRKSRSDGEIVYEYSSP